MLYVPSTQAEMNGCHVPELASLLLLYPLALVPSLTTAVCSLLRKVRHRDELFLACFPCRLSLSLFRCRFLQLTADRSGIVREFTRMS